MFKKNLVTSANWRSDYLMLQNVYISLPYIMSARTSGIDKIVEIASLSIYVKKTAVSKKY